MTENPRNTIRFILNGQDIELGAISPRLTLLDWLRLDRRMTGSKEGCAEGDCGACTVLVGRLLGGKLTYETVNACIRFMGSLNASHVVTVEHLKGDDGILHPVQQAMVDCHGSQCGFCTPGFVMSLYGLWLSEDSPSRERIEQALQGNLCRCTGYEPIIKAAERAAEIRPTAIFDPIEKTRNAVIGKLTQIARGPSVHIAHNGDDLHVPATVGDLAEILGQHPHATVVAGATDVGLWVTKQMLPINPVIFIGGIEALQTIEATDEKIVIGAGVTYTQALATLAKSYPALGRLLPRIGGEQVRNMGTIGGNIANGSPIGDTPPPLMVLGATVTLRKGATLREVRLEDYFIAYGKQDRQPGEFVESVSIPALPKGEQFAVYKITKRSDEDISALCGAFRVSISDNGVVETARIAFGGMAATPKRAGAVDEALIGKPWTFETIEAAVAAFPVDYQPITDMRASTEYRMLAAQNLLRRFHLETTGVGERLQRVVA
ncbi:MAG: xanthine dehydrogenase small subunit [Rhizobium sp.]|nr:xanthine dehydrogenase small subunit [Rhizobium sp.]